MFTKSFVRSNSSALGVGSRNVIRPFEANAASAIDASSSRNGKANALNFNGSSAIDRKAIASPIAYRTKASRFSLNDFKLADPTM